MTSMFIKVCGITRVIPQTLMKGEVIYGEPPPPLIGGWRLLDQDRS